MKCYSIILGALFLAVPVHPISRNYVATSLYSVGIISSISYLTRPLGFLKQDLINFKANPIIFEKLKKDGLLNPLRDFVTALACSVGLYDLHKPSLVKLWNKHKLNKKFDEDRNQKQLTFLREEKRKENKMGLKVR